MDCAPHRYPRRTTTTTSDPSRARFRSLPEHCASTPGSRSSTPSARPARCSRRLTAGAESAVDPSYPAIHRSVRLADGLRPEAGELFNLPGWEVEPDEPGAWDEAARAAFGLRFAEAVERRLATSSRSFAAVAATGGAELPAGRGAAELEVELRDGSASSGGRELRWGEDLRAGDILVDGDHYTVLVADDGDGRLSASDTVAHCWRRPPALTTLAAVLPAPPTRARLLRHGS